MRRLLIAALGSRPGVALIHERTQRQRRLAVCLLVLLTGLIEAAPAVGAHGSKNHLSIPRGAVVTRMGEAGVARAVTTQADGKIVVGGNARLELEPFAQPHFALIRYLSNGRVDPTFARFPTVDAPIGVLAGLALQPDGKVVAIGVNGGSSTDFLVARYLPDGRLDPSFGGSGSVQTDVDFGQIDQASALAIQSDGKILVAGTSRSPFSTISTPTQIAIARYNPDGSLDQSFGSGGKATASVTGSTQVFAVRVAPDGSITVAGAHEPGFSHPEVAMARFSSLGVADPSFGTGGVQVAPFPSISISSFTGMGFLPDGRVVAAGDTFVGKKDRVVVERLTANGSPDGSFGSGGASVFGDIAGLSAADVDPNGAVFAASIGFSGDPRKLLVSKFSPRGGFDRRFGRHGTSAMRFRLAKAVAGGIASDRFGRILVAGAFKPPQTKEFLLARFKPRGQPDRGFGSRRKRAPGKH